MNNISAKSFGSLAGHRWLLVAKWLSVASIVVSQIGCQCVGPTGTCLRPEGPILTTAHQLRQEHLERSQYWRTIPEPQLQGEPAHQPPSRFHPVPTRNVFQPQQMGQPISGMLPPMVGPDPSLPYPGDPMAPDGLTPDAFGDGMPGYQPAPQMMDRGSETEELPAPLPGDQVPLPPELERPETLDDKVTHNRLIQYPYTLDLETPYSHWVRGVEYTQPQSSVPARMATPAIPDRPLSSAPKNAPTQTTPYPLHPFAPPVSVSAYQATGPEPLIPAGPISQVAGPVIQRKTQYGPVEAVTTILPDTQKPATFGTQNGVPYYPTIDASHAMYREPLPMVVRPGQNQPRTPVQLHSAMQRQYQSPTTVLR